MIRVATGADMLVWIAVMWAAFRLTDTVCTLAAVVGTATAGVIRRYLTRRRIARKWARFKAARPDLFEGR